MVIQATVGTAWDLWSIISILLNSEHMQVEPEIQFLESRSIKDTHIYIYIFIYFIIFIFIYIFIDTHIYIYMVTISEMRLLLACNVQYHCICCKQNRSTPTD